MDLLLNSERCVAESHYHYLVGTIYAWVNIMKWPAFEAHTHTALLLLHMSFVRCRQMRRQ
jgi:hypothetical protein